MKTIKRTIGFALAITLFLVSFNEAKASVGRSAARNFINKTSYIISEAYEIVSYYNYYSTGYLAKSINHQQYAKYLYDRGFYSYAVYHSNLARKYSLHIIYSCNDYWNNYYNYYRYGFDYRKYHFAGRPIPPRPSSNSGYNPHPYHYHGNGHGNYHGGYHGNDHGNYHGQPSGKPAGNNTGNSGNYGTRQSNSGINANNKYSNSKYYSTANGVETKDFDTWNDSYYTEDEKMLIVDMPTETTLTAELNKNASVSMKLSSDKDAVNKGIKTFNDDVVSYKSEKATEAQSISITSPKELSTAPNRSSARSTTNATINSEPKASTSSTVTRPASTTTSSSVNRSVNTNTTNRSTTSSVPTRTTVPVSSSTTSKSMSTSTSTTTRSTSTSSSSAVRTAPASSSTTSKSTPSSSSSSSSTNRSTARH